MDIKKDNNLHSQNRDVSTNYVENITRIISLLGFWMNPITGFCFFIDLIILMFFGFIWQVIVSNPKLHPFILARKWFTYYARKIA